MSESAVELRSSKRRKIESTSSVAVLHEIPMLFGEFQETSMVTRLKKHLKSVDDPTLVFHWHMDTVQLCVDAINAGLVHVALPTYLQEPVTLRFHKSN